MALPARHLLAQGKVIATLGRTVALPARVGVYVSDGNRVHVGDAPGGPAYLTGHFSERISW